MLKLLWEPSTRIWGFILPISTGGHIVFLKAAALMIRLFSDLFFEMLPASRGALEKTDHTASECQKLTDFVK